MMENIKLIVSDNDGTLVDDTTHKLSKYGLDVFERLHSKGYLIGIASGRSVAQVQNLTSDYGLSFSFDLAIGLNGAEAYDLKNDLFEHYCDLEKSSTKDIIEKMMAKFPWLNPTCYDGNTRICLRDPDDSKYFAGKGSHIKMMDNHIVKDLSEFWEHDIGKLMFRVTEEEMDIIWPYAKSLDNDAYYATKTQTTMLEFNNSEASKDKAIEKYCKRNNIDLKDVMACGDMDNDEAILSRCGIGVAMANAPKHTKDVADMVTEFDNNHDGLPIFLEKFLLNN